ncbi:MAG: YihY/virulence factor BrkB family protein, partial [Candidatus Omnitrophota bacterium]
IAKGFGFEKILETQLLGRFPGQEEIIMQAINFANSFLQKTRGGLVAGVGVAILFWTVIKVLGNIERSFNDIWGIKQARKLVRKFSDYLSVMLVCPILIIISSSITVFITTQVELIAEKVLLLGAISPLISFVLKLLPYSMIWILFTFIYIFMPNTKVNFKSGLLAGVFAGSIYEIVQWIYITFQVGAVKYNAIYGSFAALPLFLVWIQMSWLIVLFGAEVSFAHQNVDMYELEPDCLHASYSFRKLLTLRVANLLIKNFSKGEKPLTASQVSHLIELPIRLTRQILYELVQANVLSEAKTEEYKETAYQPARDIQVLTIKSVIDAWEQKGVEDIPITQTEELKELQENLQKFSSIIEKSSANKLLKDI